MANDHTPPPTDGPKSKPKKGSWLSTNDWLGMPPAQTPPPVEELVSPTERTDRHPTPDHADVEFRPADTEQLEEIRKSLPSSSAIIAKSELADAAVAEDDDEDSGIDLATPPGGATTGPPSLSKILKATGTKSDIIRNSGADSGDALGYTPTAPGSGWLTGQRQPPKTGGSRVDIGNMPRKPEDIADIFSGARADSSGPPSGTGSNLLPGMSGIGRSSVFADSRSGSSGIGAGAESDLFAGLTGTGERGSSVYDDSSKRTTPLAGSKHDDDDEEDSVPLLGDDLLDSPGRPISSGPPSSARLADRLLAGLADSGGHSRPDFNVLDGSPGGSNLFDDVTAMDIDLGSDPGASASGLNWLDPNRVGAQDSGPGSSIFQKPPGLDASNAGHVDLSNIPLLGSTDDPAEMAQLSDLEGPPSSVLKKELEKAMREIKAEGGTVSFEMPGAADDDKIEWSAPPADIREQVSMRMKVSDDELDLAAPAPSGSIIGGPVLKSRKKDSDSVFDDVLEMPDDSGILGRRSASMSASILGGMTDEKIRDRHQPDTTVQPPTRAKVKSPSTHEIETPKARRGGLAATLGVLGGIAAGAAGMYFAGPLLKDSAPDQKAEAKNDAKPAAVVPAIDAETALKLADGGDPAVAYAALKAINSDAPEFLAAKGQALWMTRLRHYAEKGQKLDPKDIDLQVAKTDLTTVINRLPELKTPEEKKAAVRAALNLGLILEATGQPKKASELYTSFATKLPAYKKVFEGNVRRVTSMSKKADGTAIPANQYSLATDDALDLASANVMLLEFDPVAMTDDEAGFHFWEAIAASTDWATPGSLTKAVASIKAARKAHVERRSKLVGQGLNPLSDPTAQIFLRTCDELENYWKFKNTLYSDPDVLALARGPKAKGTDAILQDLIAARKATANLAKVVAAKDTDLAKAQSDLKAAEVAKASLLTDRDDLSKQVQASGRSLAAAQAKATEAQTKAIDAQAKAASAEKKLKETEAAIDPLIAKLKAAKLIESNATRDQALAAMPKVVIGAGGSDAEIAKELTELRGRYEKEKAEAAAMRTESDKRLAEREAKLKQDLEAAVAASAKAAKEREDRLALELAKAKAEREELAKAEAKKRQEQEENHSRQLAAARAGTAIIVSDRERENLDRARRAYDRGTQAYFAGRYADAEKSLADAVILDANDARVWYFLGLARMQLGRTEEAKRDFEKGARLEERNLPRRDEVSNSLINVQGKPRAMVEEARP